MPSINSCQSAMTVRGNSRAIFVERRPRSSGPIPGLPSFAASSLSKCSETASNSRTHGASPSVRSTTIKLDSAGRPKVA
jgi:hypothetical protein